MEWERDGGGRPTNRRTLRHAVGVPAQRVDERVYKWRGENQIAAIEDSIRGSTHYQHDARGRLVAQMGHEGRTTYRFPEGAVIQGAHHVYDEDGNLVEKAGREGVWRYLWGGSGLLRQITRPDGLQVRFEYDALARRTRKLSVRQAENGNEVVESETRFVWDGDTVLHELCSQTGLTNWYWEPGRLSPIAKEQAGRFWSIVSDHLGSPSEMYNETGRAAWSMRLDLNGTAAVDIIDATCPWRWPGQYLDEESGLHYNRFRYYDPHAGQYLSQDPIGLASGLDLYGYPDDPLAFIDPLGLSVCPGSRHDELAHGGWFGRKAWRRRLHGGVWTPHGDKHLKARTIEEAASLSSQGRRHAQYLPGLNNRALEMEALQRGTLIKGNPADPTSTVHVLYRSDSVVGYANGEPTHWIRAEITSGNAYHGHPRPLSEVRQFIPGAD